MNQTTISAFFLGETFRVQRNYSGFAELRKQRSKYTVTEVAGIYVAKYQKKREMYRERAPEIYIRVPLYL